MTKLLWFGNRCHTVEANPGLMLWWRVECDGGYQSSFTIYLLPVIVIIFIEPVIYHYNFCKCIFFVCNCSLQLNTLQMASSAAREEPFETRKSVSYPEKRQVCACVCALRDTIRLRLYPPLIPENKDELADIFSVI